MTAAIACPQDVGRYSSLFSPFSCVVPPLKTNLVLIYKGCAIVQLLVSDLWKHDNACVSPLC